MNLSLLRYLDQIDLSFNNLSTISNSYFNGLTNIKSINAKKSNLKTIEFLKELNSLQELDISNNDQLNDDLDQALLGKIYLRNLCPFPSLS